MYIKIKRILTLFTLTVFLSSISLFGQVSETKLVAPDGDEGDHFGLNTAISGNFVAIGAEYRDKQGAVYIFEQEDSEWTLTAKFKGRKNADHFGSAVSISGPFVAIGASLSDNVNGDDAGAAYIYGNRDNEWKKIATLLPDDGAERDIFGSSISISGENVIVGAIGDDDVGERSGSTYIFSRQGVDWVQKEKFVDPRGQAHDNFGYSVSIDGNYAIVGSPGFTVSSSGTSSAHIYEFDGHTWANVVELIPNSGSRYDSYGISVSISGEFAAVGANYDDDNGFNSGAVYIYHRENGEWIEFSKLFASDGTNDDWFGEVVSLYRDKLLVSARVDDDHGNGSGSVYIFNFDGVKWVEIQKLTASDAQPRDNFGLRAAISEKHAIIGAWNEDEKGLDAGAAYIFSRLDNSSKAHVWHSRFFHSLHSSRLASNYPNPFNPTTTIGYQLGEDAYVSLTVYNIAGQVVTNLVNETKVAGEHFSVWDGTDQYGQEVASGIYIYRLTAGDLVFSKKMLLAR